MKIYIKKFDIRNILICGGARFMGRYLNKEFEKHSVKKDREKEIIYQKGRNSRSCNKEQEVIMAQPITKFIIHPTRTTRLQRRHYLPYSHKYSLNKYTQTQLHALFAVHHLPGHGLQRYCPASCGMASIKEVSGSKVHTPLLHTLLCSKEIPKKTLHSFLVPQ
jgi:hypothetical protein